MRHTKASATRTAAVVIALLGIACLIPASAAAAKSDVVQLRVEGPGSTLDPGAWYAIGDEYSLKRVNEPDCSPRSGKLEFEGPSALTTLGAGAEANDDLAPVNLISFDFGPQVCSIGGLDSFGTFPGATGGWQYWVDYAGGLSSPDVATVEDGDQVLWYYARFGADEVNHGNVLELQNVPAGDTDGTFTVEVVVHEYDGTPVPFAGATIEGATSFSDEGEGEYTVNAPDGFSSLNAIDPTGLNVRSNRVDVCIDEDPSGCPDEHGRTIVGTDGKDNIRGTEGWDDVSTGKGKDRIDLSDGGADSANCGGGKDKVLIGSGQDEDVADANCEKVKEA